MKSKLFFSLAWVGLFTTSAFSQLNGSYTIDLAQTTGGSNFQTFSDFAAALNASGISGNVTATVTPGSGPYNEQVVFGTVTGSGPAAMVTIEGSGESLSAVTTTTDRHVMRLSDVQYFTVNNLHINRDTASTGGFYGIHIYNSGSHITISNCVVDMSGTSSTLFGAFVASGSLTSILDSGNFEHLTFTNDTAIGGGYGVSVFGIPGDLATDIVISENMFYDFHSNGVYLRETNGAHIRDNYFDKRTPNITSVNAIQIAQSANINANIYNNHITASQVNNGTVTFRGIYLFNGTGHKVYNNEIYDIHFTSGDVTGIEIRTAGTAPEISFNTISIDNPTGSSGDLFGIKEELSNTNSILRNNLVSITQPTTGTKAALVIGAIANVTTAFNSNNNLLWVPGGFVGFKNALTPSTYPTLASWQASSTQDANSLSLDPVFISLQLPVPTNTLADNSGVPVAGITTDILGATRGVIPDIGAYEFPTSPGMDDYAIHSSYSLYPNPFRDEIFILSDGMAASKVVFYNSMGEVQAVYDSPGKTIKTGNLPAGIYFYKVYNREGNFKGGKLVRH